ncbi:MAG: hypothetical protein ABI721_00110 [Candidatus Dojkabacteria bacterium]
MFGFKNKQIQSIIDEPVSAPIVKTVPETLPHPFSPQVNEVESTSKKRDLLKSFLKFLTIILILVLVAFSLVLAYVFFIRRDITINKVDSNATVNDDTISKAEAESRNLENVATAQKDKSQLIIGYNSSIAVEQVQNPSVNYRTAKVFEISKDLTIDDHAIPNSDKTNPDFVPIYFFSLKTLTETSAFDNIKLTNVIVNDATTSGSKKIYLDTSFTYIKDYLNLINLLKDQLKTKNITLGVYIYPIWGKEVDYNNFLQVSNAFMKTVNILDLSKQVDELVIQVYGYTNEYSILPGNVAPLNWSTKVIQYIASLGVDRSKVLFEMNSDAYVWPEREVSNDPKLNYSVADVQAEVLSFDMFLQRFKTEISGIQTNDTLENIQEIEADSKKYIGVYPTNDNIDKIIENVALYGFKGYILK